VLHVIPSLSLAHGGPSVALRAIERALSAGGVCVHTVTTDDDGPDRRLPRPVGEPVEENGAVRWYFPKQTEFYKVSLPLLRWLRKSISSYDLVHIHAVFSFASIVAARIALRANVPYIIRPLGLLNRYGMTQRRRALKRLSWTLVERRLLSRAAAVHFTSSSEQAEAEMLGQPMQSVVIPLGIEPSGPGDADIFFGQHPDLRDRQIVVFLSRIDPKKNLESLLCATAKLAPILSRLVLVIGGDGEAHYVARLKELATELGIADRVRWLGRVDGTYKHALLAASQVFVLPSLSENFGIAVVEALFAGLPCVVNSGVALGVDIESAAAGRVAGSDPDSLAGAIREYLLDELLRQEAAVNARRLAVDKFSAAVMGERLKELYQRILDRETDPMSRGGKRSSAPPS
jgi:glycosyltransferase involved in cell wall biosynthesis